MRRGFTIKRNLMLASLDRMGIRRAVDSKGTFYVWASIEDLPVPLSDAEVFFRKALERKVVTVLGIFFDVNPGGGRRRPTPFGSWVRFSFGPPEANLRTGLQRLEELVREHRG